MTFREKLKIEHPECINPKNFGGCDGCPSTYDYEITSPPWCHNDTNTCALCWSREIPGTDDAVTQNPNREPERVIRFKRFVRGNVFGVGDVYIDLDEMLNTWLDAHPKAAILDVQYQDNKQHCSVLLMYNEPIEEKKEVLG